MLDQALANKASDIHLTSCASDDSLGQSGAVTDWSASPGPRGHVRLFAGDVLKDFAGDYYGAPPTAVRDSRERELQRTTPTT